MPIAAGSNPLPLAERAFEVPPGIPPALPPGLVTGTEYAVADVVIDGDLVMYDGTDGSRIVSAGVSVAAISTVVAYPHPFLMMGA
jgi:hypothetical protein